MRIILDANSLIYMIKTNLFIRFTELTSNPIVIDTSVYKEVVEDGQSVKVKIEDINQEEKRISLALAGGMADDEEDEEKGVDNIKEYMQKHEKSDTGNSMGTLGEILKARLQEKESK